MLAYKLEEHGIGVSWYLEVPRNYKKLLFYNTQ